MAPEPHAPDGPPEASATESEPATDSPRRRHDRLFFVAVATKGIDGILEIIGGVLLLVFGTGGLNRAVRLLTQHELAEDPADFLATLLRHHIRNLDLSSLHFAAAYLLVHGVIKVGLVGGLIRRRRRVFPVALAFLGVFLLYQVYRLARQPSAGLALLSVIDLAIMVLVWREYAMLRARAAGA